MAKFSGGICSLDDDREPLYIEREPEVGRPSLKTATRDLYLDSMSYVWDPDDAEKASIHKRVSRGMPVTPRKSSAELAGDFGTECIFERVWLYPLAVSGFITEDTEIDTILWNAFQYRKVTVSSIVGTETDGTTLDYDTPPFDLQIFEERDYTLTILKDGPPVQDTTYVFTIDGIDYTMEITGIRILPVIPDPNWTAGIRLKYEFETAIYQTARFHEQRRSLVDRSWRHIQVTFNLDNRDKEKFFHQTVYGHDKVFGVPVYQEKLYPTAISTGAYSITFSNATDNMWNLLNRSSYVILVNHAAFTAEVKSIDQITSNQITFDNPIAGTFDANSTYVYPCMFMLIDSVKINNETDGVDSAAVSFGEFDDGG